MQKIFLGVLLLITSVFADNNQTQNGEKNTTEEKVGIFENLGAYIPLDTEFISHTGKKVTIKELSNGKPLVMTFNYHRCASICSPQLAGVADVVNKLDLIPGTDYNLATFSVDPTDSYLFAAKKQIAFSNIIQNHPSIETSWNFLVNPDEKTIKDLAKLVGFGYKKTEKDGVVDYLHPAILVIMSPEGKITRYLNGLDNYLPFDLKLALIESGDGKTGPTIARTIAYCFAYDAASKKYVLQMEKIFAILFSLILLVFFIYLVRSRKKK
ncbi:MAG: Unknown protein [uncultured Campylobacterales bacterium]|uniref:Cytochrome oxidase biogenesis protein Sco1/SenC/PrrC, copper metallochaperone n=1 Tax=uncultured Campylobacterales bacterium TaxID=352960 RepID=A0A6S6T5D0_9BACT|nr:MAG: Unknown protein [uncultured Campylobacterales bacterium]